MPKLVEITLDRLTCEFADEVPGGLLEITGRLVAFTYDVESEIKQSIALFEFTGGPIRLRKGESKEIHGEARVHMHAGGQDHPLRIAPEFVKFGGDLHQIGSEWQVLKADGFGTINLDPVAWRLYFGRNRRIVRADFSSRFVHVF